MKYFSLLSLSLALFSCDSYQASKSHINPPQVIETITLLGDTLTSPELKESKSFDQFKSAQLNYFDNQDSPEALIWYGRRIAYLGYFKEAIKVFTLGIETYPNDARFYRHRGHRYISTRQYDKAINDFEKAVILIDQTIDQIEPDGLPNSKNIPLSTLHGNIWYHLGLTYYLKNDMNNALKAFTNRSVTHKYDDQVNQEMNIIENMSYHQSCLFYKGLLEESELVIDEVALYSLANWYIYEKNDTLKAKEYYQELLKGNPFSFAYIAGEADWVRLYE
jgi:tetratricopeptide (TPR) repeat protein